MVLKWFTVSGISIWNYLLCKKSKTWKFTFLFKKKDGFCRLCYTKLAVLNFEVGLMYSIEALSNDGHPQKVHSELFI